MRSTSKSKAKAAIPLVSVWFQPEAPAGSAVRHVAALCSGLGGVELRFVRPGKKALKLGECASARGARSSVKVPVTAPDGRKVGELRLYFWPGRKLETEQEVHVRRVAQELGEQWLHV